MATEDEFTRRLWKVRVEPANQYCADCSAPESTWTSVTFGIFLCHKCAGVHRSLGTQISQVKSVTMDKWSDELLKNLETIGNDKSNAKYEQYPPPTRLKRRPTAESPYQQRLEWIRAKYVDQEFTRKPAMQENRGVDLLAESMPVRLVDYFVVLGRGRPMQQSRGDRKYEGTILDAVYSPQIIEHYPREEHKDAPLSPNMAMFAFPKGVVLSVNEERPISYPFVLTKVNGAKQYGLCLIFYERLDPLETVSLTADLGQAGVSVDQDASERIYKKNLFSPKCICVVSHWPFYSVFEGFLKMLYRVCQSAPPLPIERVIANFVHELPVPPAGVIKVLYTIADEVFHIVRPPPNQLPLFDLSMLTLFECLSHDNIVSIFIAIATEQRIVFCSQSYSVLTHVIESFCALLFPFYWQGVYMPLLPITLIDFLSAPVPFIAGVHDSFLVEYGEPEDVVFVDIDHNSVSVPADLDLPSLPDKDAQKLMKRLKANADVFILNGPTPQFADLAFPHGEDMKPVTQFASTGGVAISEKKEVSTGEMFGLRRGSQLTIDSRTGNKKQFKQGEVRQAFLRVWEKMLLKYRSFMIPPPKSDPNSIPEDLFDRDAFLSDAPDAARPFLTLFMQTQMFSFFVNERWAPPGEAASTNDEVRFFDECIVAKLNRSTATFRKESTPFLDDNTRAITKTFYAPPPDTSGLPKQLYRYEYFPRLQDELFGAPRYVKPLIEENVLQRRQMMKMMQKVTNVLMVSDQNTRRDWKETLRAVVMIQCHYRGYAARLRYKKVQRAAKFVRSRMTMAFRTRQAVQRLRQCVEAASTVQACVRSALKEREMSRVRDASCTLQAYFRSLLGVRRSALINHSATVIQRRWREMKEIREVRSSYLRKRRAARTLQGQLRSKLVQDRFHARRRACVVLQAGLRTCLAEEDLLTTRQAVEWVRARLLTKHVRSVFLGKVRSVITIQAIVRGRSTRRRQFLAIKQNLTKCRRELLELWDQAHTSLFYRARFWIVFREVTFLNRAIHEEEVSLLRTTLRNKSDGHLEQGKRTLQKERESMYDVLKHHMSEERREVLFKRMEVPVKSKKRKQRLLDALWSNAHIKSTIYPTLQDSKSEEHLQHRRGGGGLYTVFGFVDNPEFEYHDRCAEVTLSILSVNQGDPEADMMRLKREQRVRHNILCTLQSSLDSMKKHRETHQVLRTRISGLEHRNKELQRTIRTQHLELLKGSSAKGPNVPRARTATSSIFGSRRRLSKQQQGLSDRVTQLHRIHASNGQSSNPALARPTTTPK